MQALPTYWLTRFLILRSLGAVYAIAFLATINQAIPLIGTNGLLPVGTYLQSLTHYLGSTGAGFLRVPSFFWFVHSDTALLTVAWIGLLLSIVVLAGFANAPMLTILWLLYMSFVNVGQDWYGYGWEIQLTRNQASSPSSSAHSLDPRPFPNDLRPCQLLFYSAGSPFVHAWRRADQIPRGSNMAQWHRTVLLFRNTAHSRPLTRWFHFLPHSSLKFGVWFNWLAELVAPLFVFWPGLPVHIAGAIIVCFQFILILSGNLSFLNWLTIIPALACFDDTFWAKLLPGIPHKKAETAADKAENQNPWLSPPGPLRLSSRSSVSSPSSTCFPQIRS